MIVPLKGFGHRAVMHCDVIRTLILTVGNIIAEKPYMFLNNFKYLVDRRTSSNKQNEVKQAEGSFSFLSGAQWAITKRECSC